MATIRNQSVSKERPTAQGNNSPFIVIHTANGTVRKPNPNYIPPKKGIIQILFGK